MSDVVVPPRRLLLSAPAIAGPAGVTPVVKEARRLWELAEALYQGGRDADAAVGFDKAATLLEREESPTLIGQCEQVAQLARRNAAICRSPTAT
jgi:hypothetical protein